MLFICLMTLAIFCLHRYYELSKTDSRDHFACHPLLLFAQNLVGSCSTSQKLSRLFAFGGEKEKLLAAQALIASPHDVSVDHIPSLLALALDEFDSSKISTGITSLTYITDGRPDISLSILRNDLAFSFLSKLQTLSDKSWWPMLHHLYISLASSISSSDDEQVILQSNILNIFVNQLKKADPQSLSLSGSLLSLSIFSRHSAIAFTLKDDIELLQLLTDMSNWEDHGQDALQNNSESPHAFAIKILQNIDSIVSDIDADSDSEELDENNRNENTEEFMVAMDGSTIVNQALKESSPSSEEEVSESQKNVDVTSEMRNGHNLTQLVAEGDKSYNSDNSINTPEKNDAIARDVKIRRKRQARESVPDGAENNSAGKRKRSPRRKNGDNDDGVESRSKRNKQRPGGKKRPNN